MTYLVWPDTLGQPNRDGYGETLGTGDQSTPTETGLPRIRQRYTLAADKVAAVYAWTADQYGDFLAFRSALQAAGGGFFLWPAPLADGWPLLGDGVSLADEAGDPLLVEAPRIVAFDPQSPPQISLRGNFRLVTLSLILMP